MSLAKGLAGIKCNEKDEIKFECEFNKELKPEDVVWLKDGVKINPNEDPRIMLISEGPKQYLVVKNCELDDAGTFEIRCKGVKSQANLKVKGKIFLKPNLMILKNYIMLTVFCRRASCFRKTFGRLVQSGRKRQSCT